MGKHSTFLEIIMQGISEEYRMFPLEFSLKVFSLKKGIFKSFKFSVIRK